MPTKCRNLIALVLASLFSACTTEQIVTPDYLLNDASQSIRITLNDGRVIRMSQGDYNVYKQADSPFLSGVGIQCKVDDQQKYNFKGKVRFSDIRELQIIDLPTNLVTVPAIVVVSLFVAFFYVASHANLGG